MEIDLDMFLAIEEGRFRLHEAWIENGKRWRTNGRMVVWEDAPGEPDSQLCEEGKEARRFPDVAKVLEPYLAQVKDEDYAPLKIDKTQTGKSFVCDYGDGGEEYRWHTLVWVSGLCFDYDYLSRIMLLPGAVYAPVPDPELLALLVRWERGGALVMGIEPDGIPKKN